MIEQFFRVRGIEIHVESEGDKILPTIVFLHGFTGSTTTWYEISELIGDGFRKIAVDLTGHGKTSVPEDFERYSMQQQIEDLEELFDQMELTRFTLLGYSMGGRIALAYTLRYPERVSSLILESTSPGLKTADERLSRRESDTKLAERIMNIGIVGFVDFWEDIPLFKTQKRLSDKMRLSVRNERLAQNELGLANSLRGMGTGSQPSYWEELTTINVPTLLLAGEEDEKFVAISREMEQTIPNVRHETIKQAGHAIHVEKPREFATMIKEHIDS